MAKKKPTRKTEPFQIRLHVIVKERLQKVADRKLTSLTDEIREAIRKHLEAEGEWPPSDVK